LSNCRIVSKMGKTYFCTTKYCSVCKSKNGCLHAHINHIYLHVNQSSYIISISWTNCLYNSPIICIWNYIKNILILNIISRPNGASHRVWGWPIFVDTLIPVIYSPWPQIVTLQIVTLFSKLSHFFPFFVLFYYSPKMVPFE